MLLRENKRLKSKKDKETLNRFKRDIFDNSIPISTTISKYFKTTKDIKTKIQHIIHKNTTCQRVSEEVRYNLRKTREPSETGGNAYADRGSSSRSKYLT